VILVTGRILGKRTPRVGMLFNGGTLRPASRYATVHCARQPEERPRSTSWSVGTAAPAARDRKNRPDLSRKKIKHEALYIGCHHLHCYHVCRETLTEFLLIVMGNVLGFVINLRIYFVFFPLLICFCSEFIYIYIYIDN
jgi:hypothetical protein